MSEKGGDSMSVSKGKRGFFVKLLCFVLALAAGGALGVGGTLFFQWQALPPPEEVFPYWYEPPAPVREESGVTVTLTEANRKHTGAGTLAYTLKNDTEQSLSFSVSMRALDYLYQGEYHRIYPSPNSERSSGEITLEPGEELPLSLRFYTSVLSRPGTYRLYVESGDEVTFRVGLNSDVMF